jgi:predicted flap endonuclease-1-like 5' DNA nuclease
VIKGASVSALQGIGPKSTDALAAALGVYTVADLAQNRYVSACSADQSPDAALGDHGHRHYQLILIAHLLD